MVLLAREDVLTTEVLEWEGLHLLHFWGSTCSQKLRIALDLKGLEWHSHPINLARRENYSDWFMGINPRGLVPVLVHDGQVIIESNDILAYVETLAPTPTLLPAGQRAEIEESLDLEDRLHLPMRSLTMRYLMPARLVKRSPEELERYRNTGSGTVEGKPDEHIRQEHDYWKAFAAHGGVPDAQIRESAEALNNAFQGLDAQVTGKHYLFGDAICHADIAWWITIHRVRATGYPLRQLHEQLWHWYNRLLDVPAFKRESKSPVPLRLVATAIQFSNWVRRRDLRRVAGL